MPNIQIQMLEGRSRDERQRLAKAITETACKVLDVPPTAVDIIITEVKCENWVTAGRAWDE